MIEPSISRIKHAWAASFLIATAVWMASAQAAPAPPPAAVVNQLLAGQSQITFTATQMGVPMQGHFGKLEGAVVWNAAQPAQSKIRLVVPVASATLGSDDADAELPKAEWFSAAQFPRAMFESTQIKNLGGGKWEVAGTLSIKNISLPVSTQAALTQTGSVITAVGQFEIKRLAYKIGQGSWSDTSVVADPVKVQYRIALQAR